MGILKDLMDLATSDDGVYPMHTIMASTLQMMCKLNESIKECACPPRL
jgi:hypothetical protein